MPIQWKNVRITKEVWKRAQKTIAGEDVDLDDFLSYILEMADMDDLLSNYLSLLEEEAKEEEEEEDEDVP